MVIVTLLSDVLTPVGIKIQSPDEASFRYASFGFIGLYIIPQSVTNVLTIYILGNVIDSLNTGGIGGIILPEGVLFGTQKDDKEIRRYLLEKTRLEAVVSMPGGVFQPYAGVKTSVLIFTKGKPTETVWFYDMKGDGSSLSSAHKFGSQYSNDIPDLLTKWHDKAKSNQSWTVPVKDIIENDYILSANAYNPNIGGEEKQHRLPAEILKEISETQKDLTRGLDKIKEFLT